MRRYPTSFRVWGLLTAGLTAAQMVWEYQTTPRPRDSLLGSYLRLASGADPLSDAGPIIGGTVVLAAMLSVPAWLLYAIATLPGLLLTRRPASEQTDDYDDPPAG